MTPDDLREKEIRLQELTREGAVEERNYERAAMLRDEADLLQAEYLEAAHARWLEESGIPATRMLKDETERLLSMEGALHERVIGQDAAVGAVSEAVRKARRPRLANLNRPIGSFIFLSPTGVGKTELARALAE